MNNLAKSSLENVLFNVKWILPLFYLGLVAVLCLYGYTYVIHLCSLFAHAAVNIDEMKIIVLDMVDVVMVANLVKMIITGSYHSFISKNHGKEDDKVSSGVLKIKIASSIIVVGMINLLRTFVSDPTGLIPWDALGKQLSIFAAFLVATLVLGKLESMHDQNHSTEKHNEPHH